MIELEHSPLGGSGAKRWMACAGSFLLHRELLIAGEFEDLSSSYADLGTAAHELAAKCLIEEREPFEFIGHSFGGYVAGEDISLDAVAYYVNHCESLYPRDGKGTVLIERTLKAPDVQPYLKGTVDFGYWRRQGMWLRDYKNGEGVAVEAKDNPQLLYYGFLMALEHPWLREGPKDLPVSLGIVQPNYYGLHNDVEDWTVSLGYVLEFGHDALVPRMNALSAPQDIDESDFVPGEHCQFCPVMLECPKLRKAFDTYAIGSEFIEMLTDQEIADLYALREPARMFMNALDKVAYARVIGGSDIPTAKLVAKKVDRQWKPEAEARIAAELGDAAYKKREMLSPAAMEKLSSRGKALALEFGYKPESTGYSLAPITDRRPAVKPPTNADTFAAFATSNNEYEGF